MTTELTESRDATLRQTATALFTRRYPLLSGCASLANHRLVAWCAGELHGTVSCNTEMGRMLVPIDDFVGRSLFFVGDIDRKISCLCRRIIRPGDTVLDIGANIGAVTLLMSQLTGPSGVVHSFEPQPSLVALMQASLELNSCCNVVVHQVALGAVTGVARLSVPSHNAGAASLLEARQSLRGTKLDVNVARLDDVVSSADAGRIRLVKMDVEGFEAEVLQGAQELFRSKRPDAVLFELNDSEGEHFCDAPVVQTLSRLDYQFYAIPKCMFRMRLHRIDDLDKASVTGHDFLAISNSETSEQLAKVVRIHH